MRGRKSQVGCRTGSCPAYSLRGWRPEIQNSPQQYQEDNPTTTTRERAGAGYAPVRVTLITGDELICLYDGGASLLWRLTALDAAGELRDFDFCIEETETE